MPDIGDDDDVERVCRGCVGEDHLRAEHLSDNPRYALLNEQIFAARGEDLHIEIRGPERLSTTAQTILPEAACTSVQLHQQIDPSAFAAPPIQGGHFRLDATRMLRSGLPLAPSPRR